MIILQFFSVFVFLDKDSAYIAASNYIIKIYNIARYFYNINKADNIGVGLVIRRSLNNITPRNAKGGLHT